MKLQLKMLFSPVKWLMCLIFVCMLPILLYVPTYFDFVNTSTMFLPFIGIVLFSDVAILDQGNGTEEIAYLSSRKPIRVLLQRYLITLALLLLYILLANMVFRSMQQIKGEWMIEPISLFEYVANASGGSLLIGTMSMTISAMLGNVYIGYGCSTLYWLYWNVNWRKEIAINPFPFIVNPTSYEVPLIILFLLTLALITLVCFFSKKSPFYLTDQIRKWFIVH